MSLSAWLLSQSWPQSFRHCRRRALRFPLWKSHRRRAIITSATAVLVISATASLQSLGTARAAWVPNLWSTSTPLLAARCFGLHAPTTFGGATKVGDGTINRPRLDTMQRKLSLPGGEGSEDGEAPIPYGRARTRQGIRLLGVCGGIASGKSLASKLLVSDLGCAAHIDVDTLAHDVYAPGSQAIQDIGKAFGRSNVRTEDGLSIDRKKLGSIVFADPEAMKKLESIVWPQTKTLMLQRVQELEKELLPTPSRDTHLDTSQKKFPVIVVEAAVLLDAGWADLFDAVWVVRSSPATQSQRLLEHRNMDANAAATRIAAQSTRRGMGNLETELQDGTVTAVIDNEGSMDQLTKSLANALTTPTFWRDEETPRPQGGGMS